MYGVKVNKYLLPISSTMHLSVDTKKDLLLPHHCLWLLSSLHSVL